MKFQDDRYSRYKQALYTASRDPEFIKKHPDFALTHARVFYDDLQHEGYKWYAGAGVWSKTPVKEKQPTPRKKPATAGIPAHELFKVRIIAPKATIASLTASTRMLYEMADYICLRQSTPRFGRWTGDCQIVYFDFRLPR